MVCCGPELHVAFQGHPPAFEFVRWTYGLQGDDFGLYDQGFVGKLERERVREVQRYMWRWGLNALQPKATRPLEWPAPQLLAFLNIDSENKEVMGK